MVKCSKPMRNTFALFVLHFSLCMNLAVFNALHAVANISPFTDAVILFVADYLPFLLFFVLLVYEGWQWMKGRRARARELLRAIGVAGFAWLIAEALKGLVASPRPFLVIEHLKPLIRHGGYNAFPSGHVTFFFALGVALLLSGKRALGTIFMAAAFVMGLARVAAGIHWPIDVLGGILLGSSVVLLAKSGGYLKTKHQQA